MLNKVFFLFLVLVCYTHLYANEVPSNITSIVPVEDQISDFETQDAYAKIIAQDPNTLQEALHIFEKLYQQHPDDFKLSWEIEKIHFTLDQPKESVDNLSLVPYPEWIQDDDARLALAEILRNDKSTRQDALKLYFTLLEKKPNDPALLIEIAKIYADESQYPNALYIFKKIQIPNEDIPLQIKMGLFEAQLGYAKASNKRFQFILKNTPYSEYIREQYANAMMFWGDFYKAEAIYAEQKEIRPTSFQAEMHMIDAWVAEQRYSESEARALDALKEYPENSKALYAKLIEIKQLQNNGMAALSYVKQWQDSYPEDPEALYIMASIFYDMKCYENAISLYQQLLLKPDYRAEAILYLGKSYFYLGEFEAAYNIWEQGNLNNSRLEITLQYYLAGSNVLEDTFIEEVFENYPTAQELNIWADLYAQEGFLIPLIKIDTQATLLDPEYFPAQINLAEALADEFDFTHPQIIYESLLQDFPNNSKILLNQARVLSWNEEYKPSICLYNDLIALNPTNPVPKIEQARVAYWGKFFDLSMKFYDQLLDDTQGNEWGMPFLHEQIGLEKKVIALRWNKRTMHSLPYYRELMCADPGNTLWQYEYAQALCSLGLCCEPMQLYDDILRSSPLQTLVGLSYERDEMKTHPAVFANGSWWQEKGYGDLSQVGRYEATAGVEIPLSCNHKLRFAERRYLEHTYFDGKYHSADGQIAGWDCRFNAFVQANAEVGRKHYLDGFGTTYNGRAEAVFNLCDMAYLSLGFKKIDELHNYFCLAQLTQGKIWWIGLTSPINHNLTCSALCEYEEYNDSNSLKHAVINLDYAFTEYPKIFQVGLLGEYRDTAKTNIFIYNNAGNLVNIIHPYWAPQDYFLGQILFQWQHDYQPVRFCEAPNCFYNLKLALGDDTNNNFYWELKGEWQHEFYRHWKIGASFYIHRSDQWDGNGLWCNCEYRF